MVTSRQAPFFAYGGASLQHASLQYFAASVAGALAPAQVTLVYVDKDLHRRLVPHPKRSGTLATALPAAPALAYCPESEPKPVKLLRDGSSSAFHQVAGAV